MYELDEMSETFKLLGDKNRLTILAALRDRELCVCELVDLLQTSQPNVSQHMRKLKAGQLVNEEKRGQWVYYSLRLDEKLYLRELIMQLPSQKEKLDEACANQNCCE